MCCFPQLLIFIIITHSNGSNSNLQRSAISTPFKPISNGVSTSILIPSDVIVTPTQWLMNINAQQQFHLQLSINGSYGFHPTLPSTIQIIVNSETNPVQTDLDLLFSFTVSRQYFSTVFRMDNTAHNYIYPSCNKSPSDSMAYGYGDYQSNIINSTETRYTNDRETQYVEMKPKSNNINEFPLILSLTNNPMDDYLIFEYYNPSMNASQYQICAFSPGFDAEQGINIYVSAQDNGEQFAINSFEVRYLYNETIEEEEQVIQTTYDDEEYTNIDAKVYEIPSLSPTVMNRVLDEENNILIIISSDIMMYMLIGLCSCICILCIIAIYLSVKRQFKRYKSYQGGNKRTYTNDTLSTKYAMQMTGALEYNASPKYDNKHMYHQSTQSSPSVSNHNECNDMEDIDNDNDNVNILSVGEAPFVLVETKYFGLKQVQKGFKLQPPPDMEMVHSMETDDVEAVKSSNIPCSPSYSFGMKLSAQNHRYRTRPIMRRVMYEEPGSLSMSAHHVAEIVNAAMLDDVVHETEGEM